MFEEENEEGWQSPKLKDKLQQVERMFKARSYRYLDSDEVDYIADYLLVSHDIEKAIWLIENALNHFPTNELLILKYAQLLAADNQVDSALEFLLDKEEVVPTSFDFLIGIANIYSMLDNTKMTILYYEKALLLGGDEENEKNVALELAMEYRTIKQFDKAISLLKGGLKDDNHELDNLFVEELAGCYLDRGEVEKAEKVYLNHIEDYPYSFNSWFNLGNLYIQKEDNKKAVWALDYATIINDTFVPAFYNLANLYFDLEDYENAIQQFKQCIAIDSDDPMIYFSLGECYEEMADYQTAYDYYLKASRLLPQLGDAWLGRGVMNDEIGNYTKAIQELLVAVDLKPNNADVWYALAGAYQHKECPTQAIEAYEKALECDPEDVEIIIDYLVYLAESSIEDVFNTIDEKEFLKNSIATMMVLCYCHWMLGNVSESMLIFDEIVENDINLAKTLFVHFPEMKEVKYFVEYLQNFDENIDDEEF